MTLTVTKGGGTSKGWYTPINPEKYVGDATKIRFMSSWELDVHKFLDTNPNVHNWGSEIVKIPYLKRQTGRIHNYYIDYYVRLQNVRGEIVEELWEVKPFAQCKAPKNTKRKKQSTFLYEQSAWLTNEDKWAAAKKWCDARNVRFRIVTEKDIFI